MSKPLAIELTANPVIVDVEKSRRLQAVAAVQQTQREFRSRLVRIEHNHGDPIRYTEPKLTRKELKRHWKQQRREAYRRESAGTTTPSETSQGGLAFLHLESAAAPPAC